MITWTCGTCHCGQPLETDHSGVQWCWACGYEYRDGEEFGCRCGVAAIGTCALCGEGLLETDHFAAGLPGTWMAHKDCVISAGRRAAVRARCLRVSLHVTMR
jgi:hypothetical protein